MTVDAWLQAAIADAERRGLPALAPLLETLARATSALRAADFNDDPNRSSQVAREASDVKPNVSTDGSVRQGVAQDVSPRQGVAQDVSPRQGVAQDVSPRQGVAQDVSPRQGVAQDVSPAVDSVRRFVVTANTPTIEAFARRLRAGEVTAEQVTEDCLRRIDADNARLNAFILVMADDARRQARDADTELAAGRDRGPLHGVPISVKDLIDIRGTATTAASRVREGHVAQHDAGVVTRLREAGAVLIGKTNLHEFAFGTTNEDSAFGPARNPHDPSRSPGGSSGGSAAGLASGMSLASIGTDTGGSIRIPAAACGTVGLKPSFGEVLTDGVVPLSSTLDHVGPLARSVTDACFVYHALLGNAHWAPPAPMPVSGLRLGVPRAYFCDLLDDEVRARFEESLDRLRDAGVRIDEVDISHARDIAPVYLHLVLGDAAAYHAATLDSMGERYTVPVRLRLEMARYVLAEDYVRALAGREILRREVDAALVAREALVLPTLPIPAPLIGADSVNIGSGKEAIRNVMLRLTQPFNVTGHPVVSLPSGLTAAGLPCALQIVGGRMQTDALLSVALACEPHVSGREATGTP